MRHSLQFPMLRPFFATGCARLWSHWARSAPVPLGAPVCEPSQVQCCTLADRGPGAHSPGRSAMASPSQVQCCTLADHSPGAHSRAFASRLHRPLGAAAGEPSQVQCCTLADHSPENRPSHRIPKRNRPHKCGVCFVLESGSVLLSRAVTSQVPSALKGLTSVFGMGTGGSLSP